MAWTPTPEQETAVNELDRTLLVSAAAGAGKTSTLIQRILHSLKTGKGDLSRMLIVTFTRAAATELRERIANELSLSIAAGGAGAKELSKQLLLLPTAQISTIDSFCLALIREHVGKFGISPAFRLADEAENKLLLTTLMGRLLDDCYNGCVDGVSTPDFEKLVSCLSTVKGVSNAEEVLLSLYDKVRYYGDSYRILEKAGERFTAEAGKEPFATPWGKYIKERTEEKLTPFSSRLSELYHEVLLDEELCEKGYATLIQSDLDTLSSILTPLKKGDYAATKAAFDGRQKLDASRKKIEGNPFLAGEVKALHADLQNAGKTLATLHKFYLYPADKWEQMLLSLAGHAKLAARLLCVFSERVDEEKRRRGILSFSDLSHYAYLLLCDGKGGKTPLAEEMSQNFDFIYVDEYQDVNEVQDAIFAALAGPRARFMVGDVKQSIYGFRGAQPDIFANLRGEFPDYFACGDADGAVLSLVENFRSDPAVLEFVNLVFGRHMQSGLGDKIGYVEEKDRLNPHREPTGDRVTLALFEDKAYLPDEGNEGEDDIPDSPEEDAGEDTSDAPTPGMAETNYVADEIARLLKTGLHGKALKPRHFAILTSTARGADRFVEALAARGIKCAQSEDKTFFLQPEILLLLSLLNTIDNPRRDVYLAGLLLSPLYRISLDKLIAIRNSLRPQTSDAGKKSAEKAGWAPLYEALLTYHAQNPSQEIARFLSDLDRYRHMAEGCPAHVLIWQLYRETGLLSAAGTNEDGAGASRRANLLLFYDYARRFEGGSYRGLYNFLAYINQSIVQGASIAESGDNKIVRDDAVQVMTIHKSKGLEFPVCFVCDCGHEFNTRDASARALFNKEYGLALKLRDESGYGLLKNPVYNVLSAMAVDSTIEEYLRLLYVALTRAADRLYVTATVNDVSAQRAKAKCMDTKLTLTETYACRTLADLIVTAVGADDSYDLIVNGKSPLAPEAETAEEGEAPPCEEPPAPVQTQPADDADPEKTQEDYQKTLEERFSFVYPDEHLCKIAGKYAVSQLHPRALEEESESVEDRSPDTEEEERDGRTVPRFLDKERNNAAEKGTATHLFMQFCDFARAGEEGVKAELARLVDRKFISQTDASLVRVKEAAQFFNTPLYTAFTEKGARLHRELRFHARFPASAFVEEEELKATYEKETVLVQGVMDAVLETADGQLWLIDYKTDRVKEEDTLRTRHASQLAYYTAACRDIFGRLPDRVIIYSLALGRAIDLPVTLPEGI